MSGGRVHGRQRADDVLKMYRLARTGGSRELLRWLSGRAEGWAGLLDAGGDVLHGATRGQNGTAAETAGRSETRTGTPSAGTGRPPATTGTRSTGLDSAPAGIGTPLPKAGKPPHRTGGPAAGGGADADPSGADGPAAGTDAWAAEAATLATDGAKELASLGARSFSFDKGPHTVLLFPLDGPPDTLAPLLAVVAPRPLPDGLATLVSDVAVPLAMCWAAETVERSRRRVELAESRSREAVLHLLMTGQLSIAHQVAGALKPELPDPVRVCVVECPVGRRGEVARVCAEISGGRSWIVRCPVYARHLILVVPAGPDSADPPVGRRVADAVDECVVGASEDVPLSDTATGYRQAFHALAVARGLPSRHARFGAAPEAALVVGTAGARWADALLNPLLTHVPRRSHDPGSQELTATLSSWLSFSSHATQHLKIHRNTLAARLRLIGELLGLDLNRLADQAALDLALRIRATPTAPRTDRTPHVSHTPRTPDPNGRGDQGGQDSQAGQSRPTGQEEQDERKERDAPHKPVGRGETVPVPAPSQRLDHILRGPAVREWAMHQLRPLVESNGSRSTADPRATLRVWLGCEAQLAQTAAALGISVPGARKRLMRLESVFQRSLLQAPSARYDLWLALRALEIAGESAAF
ncbi:PucR family transcriptional regulator [Streptomyces sp. NPDC052042]|uniref:PucR family transcriptional regulator n=1 Tax=Streptomyces sp. NPDC052042 TaxID=3365683 RepID=UPI0037CF8487